MNITETTLGSTALYGCEDGYQLNGTNTTVCLPSGLWSGVMPFCQTGIISTGIYAFGDVCCVFSFQNEPFSNMIKVSNGYDSD